MFSIGARQLVRASADSVGGTATGWFMRPREPYQLTGPSPEGGIWTCVALEEGAPRQLVGLFAAVITPQAAAAAAPRTPAPRPF